ncbi:uncharacterized protein LOC122390655 [Amphibalanus amphitrite]|uniref:uncharacterized protein LOC122364376 n=1 Tax=Amphibalanus amphitrite TaxID=1232801 RepID=UPI001C9249A4|nr:uncharacterized protein LOC122364376 [Amphibalanus amphitrite]XP_043196217.1 uncharacterized protein LOC122367298 [Amphibalanus amphitrite]XP_043225575.1 uncharacterized protein LOC122383328 [Amphibalanus amphitrite]XP_043239739.1 uncharacterized protein LOC122390655 [Amphibalanus amphitrite]
MNLRSPTELNFGAANMAAEWARWSRDWQYYAAARELAAKPMAVQLGTFFNCAGVSAQEIATHFEWQEADGLPALLAEFEAYCNPRRNVILERFTFNTRQQRPDESVTSFLAALRSLAATCEFHDVDDMIRDRLVIGVRDQGTQRALLRQSKLTLQEAINIAISEEASTRDQQSMAGARSEEPQQNTNDVCAVSQPVAPPSSVTVSAQCRFCARVHVMRRTQCPAWGKTCNVCGGQNHFSGGIACPRRRPAGTSGAALGAAGGARAPRQRQFGSGDGRRRPPDGSGPRVAAVQTPEDEDPYIVGAVFETETDEAAISYRR